MEVTDNKHILKLAVQIRNIVLTTVQINTIFHENCVVPDNAPPPYTQLLKKDVRISGTFSTHKTEHQDYKHIISVQAQKWRWMPFHFVVSTTVSIWMERYLIKFSFCVVIQSILHNYHRASWYTPIGYGHVCYVSSLSSFLEFSVSSVSNSQTMAWIVA